MGIVADGSTLRFADDFAQAIEMAGERESGGGDSGSGKSAGRDAKA
jgi:hypothetical protein